MDSESNTKLRMQREAIRNAAEQALEGKIVAIRHTIDGGVPQRRVEGKNVDAFEDELTWDEADSIPAKQHNAMGIIHEAVLQIRNMGKRKIPLTRNELISLRREGGITEKGVDKSILKDLQKRGLIDMPDISMVRSDKKNIGNRVIVYYTAKGRAYVQGRLDPEYRPAW